MNYSVCYLDALVSLVSNAQLLGDLIVVGSDGSELLLDLSLVAGQVDVDHGQLIDAGDSLLVRLFDGALSAKGLNTNNYFNDVLAMIDTLFKTIFFIHQVVVCICDLDVCDQNTKYALVRESFFNWVYSKLIVGSVLSFFSISFIQPSFIFKYLMFKFHCHYLYASGYKMLVLTCS